MPEYRDELISYYFKQDIEKFSNTVMDNGEYRNELLNEYVMDECNSTDFENAISQPCTVYITLLDEDDP